MEAKQLGIRIKEARLAKKMTQSDVVGDFITRNMLSQIESGNAVPSIKTLNYLAGVLEISPSELLREPNGEKADTSPEELLKNISEDSVYPLYQKVKELVKNGSFAETLPLFEKLLEKKEFADEVTFLYARVSCSLAAIKQQEGKLEDALSLAKIAEQYAGEGLFSSQSLKTEALLLLSSIAGAMAARASSNNNSIT